MFKKILLMGLVVSMSAQAVEFQTVVKTPVANFMRWLSSGSPKANVAAVAIAACVVKSGFDIVSSPFRWWFNKRDRRMYSEQMSDLASKVKKNADDLASMKTAGAQNGSAALVPVVTAEQFADVQRTTQQQFAGIVSDLSTLKTAGYLQNDRFDVLMAKIKALEDARQTGDQQIAGQSTADRGELDALKNKLNNCVATVTSLQTQIGGISKKADNAFMLNQKVDDHEAKLTVLTGNVGLLQDKVFPKKQ